MTSPKEITPGNRVRLRTTPDPGEEPTIEVGIVIHVYYNDDVQAYDAYVAFFGESFPKGKPERKPYILRYLVSSLERIDD